MAVFTNRLTEVEVRKRLALCKQTEVIDEVYTFGQMLLNEAITNFRGLDTKAGSLAAYGAAIVTLLVSSSSTWLRLGNRWTAAFGLLGGLTAFLATFFSVRAMALREVPYLQTATKRSRMFDAPFPPTLWSWLALSATEKF